MLKTKLIEVFSYIIIFNFIVDFIYYLDDSKSIISLLRIGINILFVGIVFMNHLHFKNGVFQPIYFLILYSFFLLLFSSDITASLIEFSKFSTSLMYLPVSFLLVNTKEKFKYFINSIYPILGLYIVFVIISNLYNTGSVRYSNEDSEVFRVGLGDAKLYTPAFLVGMLPLLIKNDIIRKKKLYAVLGLINLIILILTIRRTAIFIIIFIPVFNYILAGNYKKIFQYILYSFLFLLITFPFIEKQFNDRLAERDYLTEEDYSYEKEGRYLELGFVLHTFYVADNTLNYLFGKEAFNTIGNYGFYDSERPIHSDYTYIFFCTGIIGLILYIIIFKNLFYKAKKMKPLLYKYGLKNMYQLYVTLFLLIIMIGVSGNIWAITYKTVTFSILGAFLGLFFSTNDLAKKTI
ncbi:hypothetical protein QLS71_002665 [Mariniflexile litorale]|uniref:O-antigen ligase-like membrane protein n=1 Tax=Mariniflexile litorale TaxID=3045158 RepID=A0AAU7EHB2_9FLAO|nr:hypothetical protein [Mariniflexile sp. KMM 9835]MDQ8209921.1 hypothetical protein [Mariniflexile sp. KMM 9835]